MVRLVAAGVDPRAAVGVARGDRELAPGVRVEVRTGATCGLGWPA